MEGINIFGIAVAIACAAFGVGIAAVGDSLTGAPLDYQQEIKPDVRPGSDPFAGIAESIESKSEMKTLADIDRETAEHEERMQHEEDEFLASLRDYQNP